MLTLAALVALLTTNSTQGAVTINAFETGGNVEISATGSLNLAAWTNVTEEGQEEFARIRPSSGDIIVGFSPSDLIDRYSEAQNFVDPGNFGTGGDAFADSLGGSVIVGIVTGADDLIVPLGYVSGADLNVTNIYSGASIASLGMDVGSYTWSWGADSTADSLTLNVIPEPSSAFLLGLGSLGVLNRRRRAEV